MLHHRSRYYLPGPLAAARLPAARTDAAVVKARRWLAALLGALALLCLACPLLTWLALRGML